MRVDAAWVRCRTTACGTGRNQGRMLGWTACFRRAAMRLLWETHLPTCAISTDSPTWRMKVDLPPCGGWGRGGARQWKRQWAGQPREGKRAVGRGNAERGRGHRLGGAVRQRQHKQKAASATDQAGHAASRQQQKASGRTMFGPVMMWNQERPCREKWGGQRR